MDPASELRQAISDWTSGFTSFLDTVTPVVDFLGGPFKIALATIAFWITAPMITALALLTGAFIKLGLVIATTPIGWILGGLALIGAAAYVLVKRWDDFVAFWRDLWKRVTDAFEVSFIHGITTMLREFNPVRLVARGLDAVLEYFTGISLIDIGAEFIDSFMDGMSGRFDVMKGWIGQKIDTQIAVIRSKASNLYDVGAALIQAFWDGLKSVWSSVKAWLADAMANLMPDWTPSWIRDRLGMTGGGKPLASVAPPEPPGAPVARYTIPGDPADVATVKQPRYALPGDPDLPRTETVQAESVDADTVTAGSFDAPEPLLVREPQKVEVNSHNQISITVPPGSTDAQMQRIIARALQQQEYEAVQRARSALND